MGKTVQHVRDLGQLANLRRGAATPEYVGGPKSKPTRTAGYFYPELMLNSVRAAKKDCYLYLSDAHFLPPFSAVFSSEEEAIAERKAILYNPQAIPDFPAPAVFAAPEQERGAIVDFKPVDSCSFIPIRLGLSDSTLNPTLPLLGTRVERAGNEDAWAFAIYAYDAHRSKWFFVKRCGKMKAGPGSELASAYDSPFYGYLDASRAAEIKRTSILARVQASKNTVVRREMFLQPADLLLSPKP